jgi:hypothetical protein
MFSQRLTVMSHESRRAKFQFLRLRWVGHGVLLLWRRNRRCEMRKSLARECPHVLLRRVRVAPQ